MARQAPIAAILVFAVAAATWGYKQRWAQRAPAAETQAVTLPSAQVVRAFSFGYDRVASDVYWMEAVQYYGNPANRDAGFPELYKFLELVTDLDPRFEYAYRFAGVAVPYNDATRGYLNIPHALALLEKGLRSRPDSWQIGLLHGFAHFWYVGDAEAAARGIEVAARAEGRPAFVPLLATRLRSHAGDPEAGLAFASSLLEQTEEPELRAELEQRVFELDVEVALRSVERAITRFTSHVGRAPLSLQELLVAEPDLREQVGEKQIEFDPESGKVSSGLVTQRLLVPKRMVDESRRDRAVGRTWEVGE